MAGTSVAEVSIPPLGLEGLLGVPGHPAGLVIFAHGSGSGRLSPRNSQVAASLREAGFATLLLDLLLPIEEHDQSNVFDIAMLASRLGDAAAWSRRQPGLAGLPIGYFGASTGGGAALAAAAADIDIAAVVSRGGRPDLAGEALPKVHAPTLLIVGSLDSQVVALNRSAISQMTCERQLEIVPGATHLFEEPGTLDAVTELARRWFREHLAGEPAAPSDGMSHFDDRRDAGRRLAVALYRFAGARPVVLALPRGGVPVAFEVAEALDAPMALAFVRKIGAPGHPELGIGAVVDGRKPQVFLNEEVIRLLHPSQGFIEAETRRQLAEIERQRMAYDVGPSVPDCAGRTVVVVDDGIATGATITAVVRSVRRQGAARIVVAVPVGPPSAVAALSRDADEVVCLMTPEDFGSVGLYYRDFSQTGDTEVVDLMWRASVRRVIQHRRCRHADRPDLTGLAAARYRPRVAKSSTA